jgi:hypothetical protein
MLEPLGLAWWIEVCTTNPTCTYYFGPFHTEIEASDEINGYVEDLSLEGAQGITAHVKYCEPQALTITDISEETLPVV